MYILSDLKGNLIQFGNFDTNIKELKQNFESAFNREIISTEDEVLCNKALLYNRFGLKIEKRVIVDIIPLPETKIPELPTEPSIEDYLIDLDFRMSKIELGLEEYA